MRVLTTIVLALGIAAGSAAADPAFRWTAPGSCPSASNVRERVERRLGARIDGAVHGIEIAITRDHGAYVALIDARAVTVANAVRTLRSTRCEALADAVAVVLARLASELRARQPPPLVEMAPASAQVVADRSDGPRANPLRSEVPVIPGPELRPLPPSTPWGGGLRVLGVSGIGALPGVSVGGELGGYVRRSEHFAEAAIAQWSQHQGFELDVVSLRGGWGPSQLPVRAWGTAEVGSVSGEAMEEVGPARWVAVGAGFGVAWPMSTYARLIGSVELVVPVGASGAVMEQTAYRPAGAAARSAFGVEVGFW